MLQLSWVNQNCELGCGPNNPLHRFALQFGFQDIASPSMWSPAVLYSGLLNYGALTEVHIGMVCWSWFARIEAPVAHPCVHKVDPNEAVKFTYGMRIIPLLWLQNLETAYGDSVKIISRIYVVLLQNSVSNRSWFSHFTVALNLEISSWFSQSNALACLRDANDDWWPSILSFCCTWTVICCSNEG